MACESTCGWNGSDRECQLSIVGGVIVISWVCCCCFFRGGTCFIETEVVVGGGFHQEKKKLRPERPDALDALDVSDATCLTRMQIATVPCVRRQIATASAYRTERGRAFSFWTQPCQGIFLLDAAVSGHFSSGRSCVRAFSYWTRPDDACHGTTFTLAVKARNIAANTRVAFANT